MGRYTLHRKSVGHLGRQERPQSDLKGKGLNTVSEMGRKYCLIPLLIALHIFPDVKVPSESTL